MDLCRPVAVVAGFVALATVAAAAVLERPKPVAAEKFFGAAVTGTNYRVRPMTASDGIMRIVEVETRYGAFQFDGIDFTWMRLRELEAAAVLENVSQSEEFTRAFGRAALAPVKLGADLVVNPVDTIGRSLTGVANMFDRVGSSLATSRAGRDSLPDSLLGVSDARRQIAVQLGVDPYTDFPPLAQRLQQIAGAMAGGALPVKAGLALIPGGVGIAISSASSVATVKDTLRDKTAAQIIVETRGNLVALEVPEDVIARFVENRNYTPADLLIASRALLQLRAQNTAAYIERAALAASRDAAYFQRRRAELLAARSAELGGLAAFVVVAGHAVNVTRSGQAVAAFPLDDLAWTAIAERTFREANAAVRQSAPGAVPVFATTGAVTPVAAAEIKRLGWKVVRLKGVR